MENYDTLLATLTLLMGTAWASGINLYAVLLVLGLGGSTGHIDLPAELTVLEDSMIMSAAGVMYCVEFFADKIPGVDSVWDAIHTFIRIPAGAMLAAGTVGDLTPALEIAAGILGGSIAATSHSAKASARLMINASPEPVSNMSASFVEDLLVLGGLWVAFNNPLIFIILFVAFVMLLIKLLPILWNLVKDIFVKIVSLIRINKKFTSNALISVKSGGMLKNDDTQRSNHVQSHHLRKHGEPKKTELLDQKSSKFDRSL